MTPSLAYERKLYCSFCGKGVDEVRKLIARPTVFICDECVTLCQAIVAGEGPQPPAALSPPQEAAVRDIVAKQLATMFDGADSRIRDVISASIRIDGSGCIAGGKFEAAAGPSIPEMAEGYRSQADQPRRKPDAPTPSRPEATRSWLAGLRPASAACEPVVVDRGLQDRREVP